MEKQKQKSQNLAKLFKELEDIAEWFGRDDLDLDEALKKYQHGLALIKDAQTQLKETENVFRVVAKKRAE